MNGQKPSLSALVSSFSDGLLSWAQSAFTDHPFASLLLIAVAATALLLSRAFWAVVSEYTKQWYFGGVPPWKVKTFVLAELKRMDVALRARQEEFDAHTEAVNLALDRAEQVEQQLLIRNVEVAELREQLRPSTEATNPAPPHTEKVVGRSIMRRSKLASIACVGTGVALGIVAATVARRR